MLLFYFPCFFHNQLKDPLSKLKAEGILHFTFEL